MQLTEYENQVDKQLLFVIVGEFTTSIEGIYGFSVFSRVSDVTYESCVKLVKWAASDISTVSTWIVSTCIAW